MTLDRTPWQYGQTHHNLLCLGVVYQRVSIPIESVSLGRAGNSAMADQIALLDRALAYLPAARCCLLADREFIGGAWLRHLRQQSVAFVIRVHANQACLFFTGSAIC
ncbi:MAG: hypothetical protein OXN90_03830 [Gemmatimonadota bacterium]|nr:hypothetical protein [Gemmatimonadota bacterium]